MTPTNFKGLAPGDWFVSPSFTRAAILIRLREDWSDAANTGRAVVIKGNGEIHSGEILGFEHSDPVWLL